MAKNPKIASWKDHIPLVLIPLLCIPVVAAAALMVAWAVVHGYGLIAMVAFVLLLVTFIYHYGKVPAYFAPPGKRTNVFSFDRDGESFESVVEQTGYSYNVMYRHQKVAILRLSIHNLSTGRRIKRIVLGDSATFLMRTDYGNWFYIEDRYHFGLAGLICLSAYDGSVLVHICNKRYYMYKIHSKKRQIIRLIDRSDRATSIDMKEEFAKVTNQT